MNISDELFKLQDKKYRDLQIKIIPTVDSDSIIGVRTPELRKFAKELIISDNYLSFLDELPHKYHEENLLHGILLGSKIKDIDILLKRLDKFLKYVDNWAVCDTISPKLFKKYPDKVYKYITKWINSKDEYKIRFGAVSLLQFYLDDNFRIDELDLVNGIKYNSYYVNMAIAWFYSFALIKQYDNVIDIFREKKLDKWIHNKAIQKGIESYRISNEKKEYLRSIKIK